MGERGPLPAHVIDAEGGEGPACPSWLRGEARREWQRVANELGRTGRLGSTDHAVLVAHCTAWARFVAVERSLGHAYVSTGSRGQSVPAAEFLVWKALHERLVATSQALGLNVSSRLRLPPAAGPTLQPPSNPLEELRARRAARLRGTMTGERGTSE